MIRPLLFLLLSASLRPRPTTPSSLCDALAIAITVGPSLSRGAGKRALFPLRATSMEINTRSSPSLSVTVPLEPGVKPVVDLKEKKSGINRALGQMMGGVMMLERQSDEFSRLSGWEWFLLGGSVIVAAGSPLAGAGEGVLDFLAPSCAALSASIGVTAEYVGRVAVADAKEVAAVAIQCAAEAESVLARSERTKAILPVCVGIGATAASVALLAPALVTQLGTICGFQIASEVYLLCPLVAVLAAAIAGLATQESALLAGQAISLGNRRFSRSGDVGRSWLSAAEQIGRNSARTTAKWTSFAAAVVPAPTIGALIPGPLEYRAVVVSALAAAQAAYYLTRAEFTLARATDAVAIKSRSAAVADTYANQGTRSGAILPFTSALSALCAAAAAATVELLPSLPPLAESMALGTFPLLGASFAAAAGVSRARCKVDAEAAKVAAETLAIEYDDGGGGGTAAVDGSDRTAAADREGGEVKDRADGILEEFSEGLGAVSDAFWHIWNETEVGSHK
eukprot:CAMPEP_0194269564 /NCGR_PEP_ID=MMETSP0169-20130528/3699_1 /TAXON_ID=218684 /ORGANISM="Corethron pennatum, Strain L29A3" /LENGTH=510 /DNA_ID=CAMNT_0039011249 /DNA_START=209 /DNA_END=1740 /DNA_ORIENTATION=-